jgi:hypothetical protein
MITGREPEPQDAITPPMDDELGRRWASPEGVLLAGEVLARLKAGVPLSRATGPQPDVDPQPGTKPSRKRRQPLPDSRPTHSGDHSRHASSSGRQAGRRHDRARSCL